MGSNPWLRWPLQSPFSCLTFYFWPSPFGADGVTLCYHHSGRVNDSSFQFWASTRFQTQDKHHCPWNSHGHLKTQDLPGQARRKCQFSVWQGTACRVSCKGLSLLRSPPALQRMHCVSRGCTIPLCAIHRLADPPAEIQGSLKAFSSLTKICHAI